MHPDTVIVERKLTDDDWTDYFHRFNIASSLPDSTGYDLDTINCEPSDRLIIDTKQIQSIFSSVTLKKSVGPDGLPATIFKKCSAELADAWCHSSRDQSTAMSFLIYGKSLSLFPFPRCHVLHPIRTLDLLALTSNVMKCFEESLLTSWRSRWRRTLTPASMRTGRGAVLKAL